jgi:4-diphosphocytidyl-2-C-methyl-D-erythritol kinase
MKVRAFAKINRSLSVLGVRPDGYHELKTVFQSLALHDTLELSRDSEGFSIVCRTPGVPRDERNLAWKAARLVWQAAGRSGEPVGRLRLTKRIPVQGGLGGGSADGAAALVGWDRLWGTGLPSERLRALAAHLGADVPFFLVGGTALGQSRGDELEPLADMPPRWVLLVFPPFGVSTPEAFRWWDEDSPGASRESQAVNDLEPPVSRRRPELLAIRSQLALAGAEQAAMTGSGSTMYGLFPEEAADAAGARALESCGWRALVNRTATRSEARL